MENRSSDRERGERKDGVCKDVQCPPVVVDEEPYSTQCTSTWVQIAVRHEELCRR